MILVRPAVFPQDAAGVAALDTRFTTDLVYTAEAGPEGVRLTLERLPAPITKRFTLDDLEGEHPWSQAWVAETDGRVVGFAAAGTWPGTGGRCSGISMWTPRIAGRASAGASSRRWPSMPQKSAHDGCGWRPATSM